MTDNKISDIQHVIFTVNNALNCFDRLDWDSYKDSFITDTVIFDYTSLNGGEPYKGSVDDFIDLVIQTLPGYNATCHQTTNPVVSIDTNGAHFFSNVTATHFLPNNTLNSDHWQGIGFYDIYLRKIDGTWKIHTWKFSNAIVTGDCIGLRTLAKERSHQTRGPRPASDNHYSY